MKYSKDGHTVYYNKYGEEIPSATTILKILNKPALIKWANYLGYKHLDVDVVVNESARLGTLIHELINAKLSNKYIIYIPRDDIPTQLVNSYMRNFNSWYNTNSIEPIFLEKQFSSNLFGGTIDFYGKLNGEFTIIDFKTSKQIRLTMFLQLALYCILLEEHDYTVNKVGILLVNNKKPVTKFISRNELDKYIEFVVGLVDVFHSYYSINNNYNWNENIY